VSEQHAEAIEKSTSLRTSARSFSPLSAFDQTHSPVSADVLYGRPLTLPNGWLTF